MACGEDIHAKKRMGSVSRRWKRTLSREEEYLMSFGMLGTYLITEWMDIVKLILPCGIGNSHFIFF
jgi:hypothetical protein